MTIELLIEPSCPQWSEAIHRDRGGELRGHSLGDWRDKTRRELGLATGRPVVATGHQAMLWHPGILAKYLVVEAFLRHAPSGTPAAGANLVVDQHVGGFGSFEVPIRRGDGSLAVRSIELVAQRKDVPMARHDAFTPPRPPGHLPVALPSVGAGIKRVFDAIDAHRDAPNAAMQMAGALADLMAPWVGPLTNVAASELLETSLARALLEMMASAPAACARAYNEAVAAVPESGIGPLLVRDDYIELPLWRLRPDGRRMRAYDSDVQMWLEDPDAVVLLPRALLMTALVRLGVCDLFVHGTGGARYDRAMEHWVRSWLGLEPAPIAVVTATLRLGLASPGGEGADVAAALAAARRAWHDPASSAARDIPGAGAVKRALLARIDGEPRGSAARRAAYLTMHERLGELRTEHAGEVEAARQRAAAALREAAAAPIADRRTWPFALYADEMIDELAEAVSDAVGGAGQPQSRLFDRPRSP